MKVLEDSKRIEDESLIDGLLQSVTVTVIVDLFLDAADVHKDLLAALERDHAAVQQAV